MNKEIHGHEVMEMMLESGKSYTKESLKIEIENKFGEDARFYTCSAQGLTSEALIEFLEDRGKFFADPEGFNTSQDVMCGDKS